MKRLISMLLMISVLWGLGLSQPGCQKSEEIGETPPAEVLTKPEKETETREEAKEKAEYREEMRERNKSLGAEQGPRE
jgi:hypothetical protein